jgi:hypothetical protein
MNLYILVEGKAEFKIYPSWLSCLLPELVRVEDYDSVENNNYYIFQSAGIPTILDIDLPNAISDVNSTGKYDYLVVCLDADELTVSKRKSKVEMVLASQTSSLGKTKLIPIIQNRCIETWLLGNRNIFPPRINSMPLDKSEPLLTYSNYYDVSTSDPEEMGKYNDDFITHSQFHKAYLKALFKTRNIRYSERDPKDALKEFYLRELRRRIQDDLDHLNTFRHFINFCDMLQTKL